MLVAVAATLASCTTLEPEASISVNRGQRVYVSNEVSGDLTVIDADRWTVLTTVPVGRRPRGMAISPDGRVLYIALSGSPIGGPDVDESQLPPADKSKDGIAVFDLRAARVARIIRGVSDPETVAVSPDGRRLYVASEDTGRLVVLDSRSGRQLGDADVGGEAEGVGVTPDGSLVYVTSEEDHTVAVVESSRLKVRARVQVGMRPRNVVFTANGQRAFVGGENDASVTAIDVATDHVVARAQVPGDLVRPMGLVLSPDGRHLYVTTGRGGEVVRLDTASLSVTGRVKAGARPWGVALTKDGKWLFTANGPSNDVTVIDAGSLKVVGRIAVGNRPWGAVVGAGG